MVIKQKIGPIQIALIIVGAVLYGLGSFATMGVAIGTVTLRPAAFISCAWGILFGPWVGGLSAAIGNTFISDILSGWFGIGGVGGFVGNFLMGFVPALLVRNARRWWEVGLWSAFSAVLCAACIAGWQVLVGIQPVFWPMFSIVCISNIPVNLIATPIVVLLLLDRVIKRNLYWKTPPPKPEKKSTA